MPRFQLHHRLSLAMEHAGVDRAEMMRVLGVSANTVSNYANGHTRPSTAVVRVWALRCGVPFEWLKDGIEPDPDGEVAPLSTKCSASIYPLRPGRTRKLGAAKAA